MDGVADLASSMLWVKARINTDLENNDNALTSAPQIHNTITLYCLP